MAEHHGGNRIARQPDHGLAAHPPRHQRLSGTHGDLVEAEVQSLRPEHVAHEVIIADRGAAEGDDQVRFRRAVQRFFQRIGIVGGDWLDFGDGAASLQQRREAVIVGGDDLRRAGAPAGSDQFIAGGDQADDRLATHLQKRRVHRRRQRDFGGGQAARRLQPRSGFEVEPGGADIGARARRLAHGQRVAVAVGVLLYQDCVRPRRDRGAGEDAHGFARADFTVERPARRNLRDHFQCGAHARIRGPHRIAVHGGGGEGRLVALGVDRRGQNPARRLRQRNAFDPGWRH